MTRNEELPVYEFCNVLHGSCIVIVIDVVSNATDTHILFLIRS